MDRIHLSANEARTVAVCLKHRFIFERANNLAYCRHTGKQYEDSLPHTGDLLFFPDRHRFGTVCGRKIVGYTEKHCGVRYDITVTKVKRRGIVHQLVVWLGDDPQTEHYDPQWRKELLWSRLTSTICPRQRGDKTGRRKRNAANNLIGGR